MIQEGCLSETSKIWSGQIIGQTHFRLQNLTTASCEQNFKDIKCNKLLEIWVLE